MAHHILGRYSLYQGIFASPQLSIPGGAFLQAGGTNLTQSLSITDDGSFMLNGGFLSTSNLILSSGDSRGFRSSFVQSNGDAFVQGLLWVGQAASLPLHAGAGKLRTL